MIVYKCVLLSCQARRLGDKPIHTAGKGNSYLMSIQLAIEYRPLYMTFKKRDVFF